MCPGNHHASENVSTRPEPEPSVPFPWHLAVFDAHCHPTTTPESIARIATMRARGLTVMASRAQDQHLSATAADELGVSTRDHLWLKGDEASPARKVIPAFGYHPWFAHLVYDDSVHPDLDKAAHFAEVLKPSAASDPDMLAALPDPEPLSAVIAATRERLLRYPIALVGEIGLDKASRIPQPREPGPDGQVDPPAPDERHLVPGGRYGRALSKYRVNMAHQERIFLAQVALAGELGRPVSVHGVQCSGLLLDALSRTWKGHEIEVISKTKQRLVAKNAANWEEYDSDEDDNSSEKTAAEAAAAVTTGGKPFPPRICLHSFSGSVGVLKQYLDPRIPSKIYFSFSAALNLGTESVREKLPEIIRACPEDRILIESDLHLAGEEMDSMLEQMYRAVCEMRSWPLNEGVERIAKNFEDFIFG